MKPSKGFDSLGNLIKEVESPKVTKPWLPEIEERAEKVAEKLAKDEAERNAIEAREARQKAKEEWDSMSEIDQLKARITQLEREAPKATEEIVEKVIQEKKKEAIKLYAYLMVGILVISALVGLWFYATYAGPRSSSNGDGAGPYSPACPTGKMWQPATQLNGYRAGCY